MLGYSEFRVRTCRSGGAPMCVTTIGCDAGVSMKCVTYIFTKIKYAFNQQLTNLPNETFPGRVRFRELSVKIIRKIKHFSN